MKSLSARRGSAGRDRSSAQRTERTTFAGHSIHVAQVALVLLELGDEGGGILLGQAAVFLGDGVEGGIDVLGHARGIAADVEGGTVLEPLPELGTLLEHEV